MSMNDEKFEESLQVLEQAMWPATAEKLRARDTAQREALARVEAELKETNQKLLAKTGAYEFVKHGVNRLVAERDAAQAQLAEAVGLIRGALEFCPTLEWENMQAFLHEYAQAEQQEALSDAELMEVAMFEGSGNKAARRAHELGVAELPGHLAPRQQEAQGAQAEYAAPHQIADAIESLEWKGCSIGHKVVLANAVAALRAALATQAAAGEPIGKVELFGINMTYVEWRDRKMPPLGTELYAAPPAATPVAVGEPVADVRGAFEEVWSQAMCNDEGVPGPKPLRSLVDPEEYRGGGVKFAWRWFQRGAQAYAPPAAAHGDEAVRKDAERYRWLRNPGQDVALVLDKKTGHVPVDEQGFGGYGIYEYRAGIELDEAIDAAMRAQGDGGSGDA